MKKQFNAFEAHELFISGKKVRRTVWEEGSFVELKSDGAYQFLTNIDGGDKVSTVELFTPSKSIEKFGFNPKKMWEVIETTAPSQKILGKFYCE